MKRLTTKIEDKNFIPTALCTTGRDGEVDDIDGCKEYCDQCKEECSECAIQKCFNKLAEYENFEDKGLLLRLPCKVGDTVYVIAPNYEKCKHKTECEDYDSEEFLVSWCKVYCRNGYKGMGVIPTIVERVEVRKTGIYIFTEYGYRNVENFFLTKTEAEQKLKEMEDK